MDIYTLEVVRINSTTHITIFSAFLGAPDLSVSAGPLPDSGGVVAGPEISIT